ncbi:MAG: hypothetical protein U0L09_04085 [Christensenellales bacterium]|nr:hypothetical protein [Christensenellales bacterium]
MKERKYKEDYSFETYMDEKGREKRKVVYRGDWFRLDADVRKRALVQSSATFLLFAAVYLFYLKLNTPGARCMYVLPIAACAVVPAVYWAMGLLSLTRLQDQITRLQKENGIGRVLRSSLGCGILMAVACLGDIVLLLSSTQELRGAEFPGFLLLCLGAASALGCFLRIRDVYNGIRKTLPASSGS